MSSSRRSSVPEYSLGAGPVRGAGSKRSCFSEATLHDRSNAIYKTVSAIKCPEMINFIQKLIGHLTERKKFKEVGKLNYIIESFSSENFDQLNVLRLSVLNEKNPIICSLIFLDRKTIESLSKIPLPAFFPDFFEKLEFYANITRLGSLSSSAEEEIDQLILFTRNLIRSDKKKEASLVLGNIQIATRTLDLDHAKRIEILKRVAFGFLDLTDRENGIAALNEVYSYIYEHRYSSFNNQIADFQELAKDFSFAKSWGEAISIINLIGQTEEFPSELRIAALMEIFKYIATHEEESFVWDIYNSSMRSPEKDMALKRLQQIAEAM